MSYIIRTSETGALAPTQPLFWTGKEVVGICRFDEREEYSTPLAAAWALAAIPERKVNFYQLEVAVCRNPLPAIGNNGWMVGHPGYDLH